MYKNIIFYCGSHPQTRKKVVAVIHRSPKFPIRLGSLIAVVALAIAALTGCGSSKAVQPTATTTATTTATATATTTAVVTVTQPVSPVCNNWDPGAAEAVNQLRFIGDEIGFGLRQAGFTVDCEFVNNPAQPTVISRHWTGPDQRSLRIVLSNEYQGVTEISFVNGGNLWTCGAKFDLSGNPLDHFPSQPAEAAGLMAAGCVASTR